MKLTQGAGSMARPKSIPELPFLMDPPKIHRRLSGIAVFYKVGKVSLHLLWGLGLASFCFPFQAAPKRFAQLQAWSARLLRILGLELAISGERAATSGPRVLVANHVSWLDVYAINTACPARFVAKSEVRRWPVIGWFAHCAGTVFIDRARPRDLLKVNARISELLRCGERVAIFPEGTTTPGDTVLAFRAPLLQPAVQQQAQLQAVAIRYARADGSLCTEADFAGDKTLLGSLGLILRQPSIQVRVHFFPPLACAGQHRRDLARRAHALVLEAVTKASRG